MQEGSSANSWPSKRAVFGVDVSVTRYFEVVHSVIAAARRGERGIATFLPVHGIITGVTDAEYRRRINQFNIVGPDGQPVRWALNRFHGAGLTDRVYGPEVMRHVCLQAAEQGLGIYLYGSTKKVLDNLKRRLTQWFPKLRISGMESPPFRRLSEEENDAVCKRINESGARIVFVGLGCPRQEVFAHSNREKISAVQLCVGAAFDFHAGTKKMAPPILQKMSLEWLFRLTQEPARLWKRYLMTNTHFVYLSGRELLKQKLGRRPAALEAAAERSPREARIEGDAMIGNLEGRGV